MLSKRRVALQFSHIDHSGHRQYIFLECSEDTPVHGVYGNKGHRERFQHLDGDRDVDGYRVQSSHVANA